MNSDKTDSLLDRVLEKINGHSLPDYTIIRSKSPPPLRDLAGEYKDRYPDRRIHSEVLISRLTDSTALYNLTSPKLWIETEVIARLLPEIVLGRLIDDKVRMIFNDGTGSYYDSASMTISNKGNQDFIHEIGHHAWNNWLIRYDEEEKRIAVNYSLQKDTESRKRLSNDMIPDLHKEYAKLIGAWSGQFIQEPESKKISDRRNDLEEHFARNFDYLMRGRPLDITPRSRSGLDVLTDFYIKAGLSDKKHISLYRYILKNIYGKRTPNAVKPGKAEDGVVITRDELFQYHKSRIEFETGKELSLTAQIAFALDLSEDFIGYCLSKKALQDIKGALRQKGVTSVVVQ
jgi:hypothetical protein